MAASTMGEGLRNQIWSYLDDPEFERHEGLRNALYRLLVASEIPRGEVPSGLDGDRCLALAAAAVRAQNTTVIASACALVDDLVVQLAMLDRQTGAATQA
jgi:hypothetical protein